MVNEREGRPGQRAGVLLACCFGITTLAGGCYRYVPITTTPESGSLIRAHLSATGAETVVRQLGPGVTNLSGTFLSRNGDEFSLLVEEYQSSRLGTQIAWNEAVRLPLSGVDVIQERRLDRVRSLMFGAGLVASVALAFVALDLDELVFAPDDNPDPGPSELRRGEVPGRIMIRLPGRTR